MGDLGKSIQPGDVPDRNLHVDNDRFVCRRTAVYSRCSHAPAGRYATRELHIGILYPTGWNRNIPARTELLSRWRDRPPDRAGVLQVNVGSFQGRSYAVVHGSTSRIRRSWSIPTVPGRSLRRAGSSPRPASGVLLAGAGPVGWSSAMRRSNRCLAAEAVLTGLELVPTMSHGDSPPTRGSAR
jgi:hypothetical protein